MMETIKRLLAAIDAVFIRRVLRFGVTGVWNTGFSYSVYALAIYFGVWHYIAVLFAYLAGAINNYLTFRFFVFGDRRSAPVSRYLVGFVCGYVLAAAVIGLFIDVLGINKYLAYLFALPLIAGFSFSVNNWYVFR